MACCTSWGTITRPIRERWAGWRSACAGGAGLPSGLIARPPRPVTRTDDRAILVFLAAVGLLFFALVEMAFTLLMRLPQRLEAERESEGDALAAYLDDPLKFFVPARLMRGALLVLLVVLLAQLVDTGWVGGMILFASGVGLAVGVGQLLPALIVRRSPERDSRPAAAGLHGRRERHQPAHGAHHRVPRSGRARGAARRTAPAGPRPRTPAAADARPQRADESRLLRSVVDFGETLVREVMTPRPDIVAIRSDATIDDLRRLVQRAGVLAPAGLHREPRQHRRPRRREGPDSDGPRRSTGTRKVTEIMRPAAFVPETKRVVDLLREFQQKPLPARDRRRRIRRHRRPRHRRGRRRGARRRDSRRVRQRGRADRARGRRRVRVQRQGRDQRHGRAAAASRSRTASSRRSAATCWRASAACRRWASASTFDGLDVEILEAERRRIHKVRVRRLPQPAAEVAG